MDEAKRSAARAAVDELPQHGIIGLGTGSTSRLFVEELARRADATSATARGRDLVGVPTSESTRTLALSLGIRLLDDEGPWAIDVNVDGADEVSEALDLIKGGGGAHAREKIVNYSAKRNVVIVDESKLSKRLGEKWPVPVEVLPFAHGATRAHLEKLGRPVLRSKSGATVRTDAGNFIYDLAAGPIDDPAALDRALHAIPGVVETGLFVGRADLVIVATRSEVKRLVRGP